MKAWDFDDTHNIRSLATETAKNGWLLASNVLGELRERSHGSAICNMFHWWDINFFSGCWYGLGATKSNSGNMSRSTRPRAETLLR